MSERKPSKRLKNVTVKLLEGLVILLIYAYIHLFLLTMNNTLQLI